MGNTSSARVHDLRRKSISEANAKKEASPKPAVDLFSVADTKDLNAAILLELLRAGFVQLWRNHEHINKVRSLINPRILEDNED